VLAGERVPDRLPPEAEAVLRALRWPGPRGREGPGEAMLTTLADPPRGGPIRDVVRDRLAHLAAR
jgi:acetoin utilization protein AcuC